MKKIWLLTAGLVALSGGMFADSIWSGSAGSLNNVPTTASFVAATPSFPDSSTTNTQVPFWNNPSPDSINGSNNITNVGDVLSGYVTGTNLIGSNLVQSGGSALVPGASGATNFNINGQYFAYTATDSTAGGGDPVTTNTGDTSTKITPSLEFSFMSTATAYNIAMLYAAPSTLNAGPASSGGPATMFGTYILTSTGCPPATFCTFTPTVVDGAVTAKTSGTPTTLYASDTLYGSGTVYGFYATVCYTWNGSGCTGWVTYTTGDGNFSTGMASGNGELGALGWNHFALFELANGEEVLGFTDSPWAPGTLYGTQGIGDFSDAVVGLTPPVSFIESGVPEPGTIAVMGLGLAGLGLIGRRRLANQ